MPSVALVLFDLGGVLLSDGWDRAQRADAAARFGIDPAALERRHAEWAVDLETGRIDWATYLARTVFAEPRTFTPTEFREYVFARSTAHPAAIEVVRALRASGRYTLATLNNESRELNDWRIDRFGLAGVFHAFYCSGVTGRRKPDPAAYRYALALSHRRPEETAFADDREENVAAARALGLRAVRVTDPGRLREELLAVGVRAD